MKTKVMLLMGLLGVITVQSKAQDYGADETECKKQRSIYGIFMNDKKYKEAIPAWKKVLTICPKSGEDIYQNGRVIYKSTLLKEAEAAKDTARIRVIQDSVLLINEKWIENYGRDVKKLTYLGQELMVFQPDKYYNKAYPILKELIELQKENTDYYTTMLYFQAVFKKRQNKKITDDEFINEYLQTTDLLDKCLKAHPDDQQKLESVLAQIDKMVSAVLKDCEKIDKVMEQIATRLPQDCAEKAVVLKKYLAFMNKKKCEDLATFKKFAVELFACEPSHEAAYNLAAMYLKEKNYQEGYKYVKQANELCNGCEESGKYQLSAAKLAYQLGQTGAARSHANAAVAYNASDAYEIIAKCILGYASTCGNTLIERKSVYWLASDYMQKAGKGADVYKGSYPTKGELFDAGVTEGSSFTVPCLGETTTVRGQ